MDRAKRFSTLEGMRGMAAICVVLMHSPGLFGLASPRSAYLAVDFFFVLSGFIIAHVYEARLDQGLSAKAFIRARIVRLYPLYVVGMISGVVIAAASLLRHSDLLWSYTQPLVSVPFGLLMLPSPASNMLFHWMLPAWSLLLELIVNIAFSVAWLRSQIALLALMTVSAVGLVVAATIMGTLDLGWDKASAAIGLARVFFSFPLGVVLYRFHQRIRFRPASVLCRFWCWWRCCLQT